MTIELDSYSNIKSCKKFILQKLNIFDRKKDYVSEFNQTLKDFINKNQSISLVFLINRESIAKELRFNLILTNNNKQDYPDNFEFGNPYNRWLNDPIIKTESEANQENIEFEKALETKLSFLKDFLNSLKQLDSERITIKEN